jgi:hypothetical protein
MIAAGPTSGAAATMTVAIVTATTIGAAVSPTASAANGNVQFEAGRHTAGFPFSD